MKKDKSIYKHKTIDQFQFHILPLSIAFAKKQPTTFYIYVEKGAQVLGKVDQRITTTQLHYHFDKLHTKRFRIANDKNLTYQWSLYRSTQDDQEEYLQSIAFNINSRLQQYLQQFQRIQNDLFRIYQEKQKKFDLEEIWKDLRHDFTKTQLQMSCTFPKINAKLNFRIIIKCEYDFLYEKWGQERQRKTNQKKIISERRGSVDSRNSRNKTSSSSSVVQVIQKPQQTVNSSSFNKSEGQNKEGELRIIKPNEEQQNLRQSEIRITNPEGIDVTGGIPERFLHHNKTMDDDMYYMKKTSMLSDIIEESYEGSSNVNLNKSNQGQKLKSVQIIQEQQQPMFSPMIKTQTFESQKHLQYFNEIKRTTTLAHKHSQEFELQQTPKNRSKKTSHNFSMQNDKNLFNQSQNQKDNILVSRNINNSSRSSSEIEEQKKQLVEDFTQAKKQTLKNIAKVLIIVALLVFALNFFNNLGNNDKHIHYRHKKPKNTKGPATNSQKPQKLQKPQKISKANIINAKQ